MLFKFDQVLKYTETWFHHHTVIAKMRKVSYTQGKGILKRHIKLLNNCIYNYSFSEVTFENIHEIGLHSLILTA